MAVTPGFAEDSAPDGPEASSSVLTPEEEAQVHEEVENAPQVYMYYKGEAIDPASADLGGAQVCAEVSEDGTMQCFDTPEESNEYLARHAPTEEARRGAATAAPATRARYDSCPNNWVCLWQHADYQGRRLQWPWYKTAKTRHLDQYSPSFRDKASSAYINRVQRGITLYDFRTGLPDPKLMLASGYSLWPNFKKYSYTYGGNWNDKADAIKF
ncbi:peptidase inhibitor family I36 protein [Streptomyces sp. 71268]|uniref:peptidase inhibitor family I36 protein n=1 Tax=Streptomyces sp. 71268 TaxID=3002640 RepID=UPI0023F8D28D|nr:peptidase inhibitor family I36 protein [Streptomyces sp. 71268]WEV27724.1 peptidase inhibitor family I36 protein [Streptomyces sp. 71268]